MLYTIFLHVPISKPDNYENARYIVPYAPNYNVYPFTCVYLYLN